jgi:hypothetical protein
VLTHQRERSARPIIPSLPPRKHLRAGTQYSKLHTFHQTTFLYDQALIFKNEGNVLFLLMSITMLVLATSRYWLSVVYNDDCGCSLSIRGEAKRGSVWERQPVGIEVRCRSGSGSGVSDAKGELRYSGFPQEYTTYDTAWNQNCSARVGSSSIAGSLFSMTLFHRHTVHLKTMIIKYKHFSSAISSKCSGAFFSEWSRSDLAKFKVFN